VRGQVRIGLLTSRMLTHWVVDGDHAQACPGELPTFYAPKQHRSTATSLKGQWLNW
jgi:hypothetical protein